MLWNREETPAELRDKKPEEIVEALKKLEELKAQQERDFAARAEMEKKYNDQKSEYEQIKTRLTEWEQYGEAQKAQQYQNMAPEPPNVWTDPDKYIDERTRGTQVAALAAARMAARLTFQQSLAPRENKIFQKYAGEVDKMMETYQPMAQGMPQNWYTAFTYVKGLHEQEIAKAESTNTQFFSEPASRGTDVQQPPPEDKLTPEEEEVVQKFHWSPEGYLKQKKLATLHQSERGSFARFPVPERKR
jgi:hypothetical protein